MPEKGKVHEHRLGLMARGPRPCPGSWRLPPSDVTGAAGRALRACSTETMKPPAAPFSRVTWKTSRKVAAWPAEEIWGTGRARPAPPFPPTGPPSADQRSGRRSLVSVDYIVTRKPGIRNKLLPAHHVGQVRALRELCPMGHCGHSDERADEVGGLRCRPAAAGGSFVRLPRSGKAGRITDRRADHGQAGGSRTGGRSGRFTPAAGPGDRRSGRCPAARPLDAGGSSRPPRPAPWR